MNQIQLDRLNEQLKQLALVAQKSEPRTKQRQLALTKMIGKILQSGKLCRPRSYRHVGIYEDVYNEAVQELFLYICEKIDKYDPERGEVIAWCNVLLERRFFRTAMQKLSQQQNFRQLTNLEIENLALAKESPLLTEILQECIESDPENLFKGERIKNCQTVNFQILAKRRMSGTSWKEIASEFDITISTLSSFYYRCLNKFTAKLKKYCRDRAI
jgi:DNA-directed RNA polymerase specialized sigma24 family protein